MPLIIPPGFVQISARYNSIAHTMEHTNECGFSVSGPLTGAEVNSISTALAAVYKAYLNSGSTFEGVKVLVGQDGAPTIQESTTGAGNGARSAALCPPQVQILCKKKTALASRKGRGRIFLPDVGETDVDDAGNVSGTSFTDANLIALQWLGLPTASGVTHLTAPVILHSDSTAPTVVTDFTAQAKVATLRRRFKRS